MAVCPVCGHGDVTVDQSRSIQAPLFAIRCPRCGLYGAEEDLIMDLNAFRENGVPRGVPLPYSPSEMHLVSGYTREMTEAGASPVVLTEESIHEIQVAAPRGVLERVERLLLNLGRMSKFAGHRLYVRPQIDYPLSYSETSEELAYLLEYLEQESFIRRPDVPALDVGELTLTLPGWSKVDEAAQRFPATMQGFVAMSFDKSLTAMYDEAIAPAIEDAGYKPLRVDREEHSDRIDERIILELNRSRFVVADFTQQKHGAYFEAGYALGRGLPVIWTCRATHADQLHFDTRQYNHIMWNDYSSLRQRLYERIRVLVG